MSSCRCSAQVFVRRSSSGHTAKTDGRHGAESSSEMPDDAVCCRCYGCEIHTHDCGLPIEEAEQQRLAHDELVGGLVRDLVTEGRVYIDRDGTPRATGY